MDEPLELGTICANIRSKMDLIIDNRHLKSYALTFSEH